MTREREPLLAAAGAAQALASVDLVGELVFRCLFGAEPRLSMKRRMQLRRTAAQLERCAGFGMGAGPGLAAEELAGWMLAHAEALDRPPAARPAGVTRPKSLGYFVVKLRRQARKWRDTERRRRGADNAKPAFAEPPTHKADK